LPQDGLSQAQVPDSLLAEVRRIQSAAERRERFWFRMACASWVTAAASFIATMGILSIGRVESMSVQSLAASGPSQLAPASSRDLHTSGWDVNPLVTAVTVLLGVLLVAAISGLVSSIRLRATRRESTAVTMQATLASLVNQVRDLQGRRQ
jgi:hypothetical protein